MKHLYIAVFFLCCCLPLSLNAQTSQEDTAVYKMSQERADSLLISLSKGKSTITNSTYNSTAYKNVFVLDSLSPEPASADAFNVKISQAELSKEDSLIVDSVISVTQNKNRKRAEINRNELLIEQFGGGISLKDENDIDYYDSRSINEGTMIGVGGYKMKDQYLSPEKYGGLGLRFMNERMRFAKMPDYKISRQNIINVDISSAINGAENSNFLSAFVDYSVGYHYHFRPDPYFKLLVGGSMRGMLGMVYNTRNGNNPMTIHADVDLNFSLISIYEFRIKKHPLAIRYQLETPFIGLLFSPVYDQSYYEIFSLGNTAEILNINSFHNKFAMRNHLTLDFPVGGLTVRTGYFGLFYSTNVHEIDRYVISHNFMLGFVKEFIAFGGREMRRRNLFHSAYY